MTATIRCEKCGQVVVTLQKPGRGVRCPCCRGKITVPAALAKLPQVRLGQAPEPRPQPGRDGHAGQYERDPAQQKIARTVPWVLSLMLHGLAALAFALVVVLTATKGPDRHALRIIGADLTGRGQLVDLPPRDHLSLQPEAPSPRHRPRRPQGPSVADELTRARIIATNLGPIRPGLPKRTVLPPGPIVPFPSVMDDGQPARCVVFVIDRSGSMMDTFAQVRAAICASVGVMTKDQRFHVVLFSSGRPLESSPRRLVAATTEHKLALARYLQGVGASGRTDPLPALRRAFELLAPAKGRGKLIHLLTDGVFPDNRKVLAAIGRLNADKTIRISTYLFGRRPPAAQAVLKKIAFENRGRYKYICPDQ